MNRHRIVIIIIDDTKAIPNFMECNKNRLKHVLMNQTQLYVYAQQFVDMRTKLATGTEHKKELISASCTERRTEKNLSSLQKLICALCTVSINNITSST